MKVRVIMTVDVDYLEWAAQLRRLRPDAEVTPAACRRNIQGLAEEGLANNLDDYVPYEFVD